MEATPTTATETSCSYNAGNAKPDRVAHDFDKLVSLFLVTAAQEVADRVDELEQTGATVLQKTGQDKGHLAFLIDPTVHVNAYGYIRCTRRSFVGAWGAGPRTLAAKWILWADLGMPDGSDYTVADIHMPPSVTRPVTGPISRIGRARRRKLYAKYVAGIVAWASTVDGPIALHGDWNAEADFELLDPLRAAGFRPIAVPTFPAHDPDRSIDIIWVRDAAPVAGRSLTGYSSDHRPMAGTYTPEETPMPRHPGHPGADQTTAWYHGRFVGSPIRPNVGVLHSTESTGRPTYEGGAKAPHYTLVPQIKACKLQVFQHYLESESSRALRNEDGGVETNTLNALQLELVGTTDPAHRKTWRVGSVTLRAGVDYIYWPEAPQWALDELADFMAKANKRLGIPLAAPAFQPYPASYGANTRDGGETNTVRFSFARWRSFQGWCAHQHVPENDHGDVYLDVDYTLKTAAAILDPTPKPTRVQLLGRQLEADLAGIGAAIAKAQATAEKYSTVPESRARVHRWISELDDKLDAALADTAAARDDYDKIPPK